MNKKLFYILLFVFLSVLSISYFKNYMDIRFIKSLDFDNIYKNVEFTDTNYIKDQNEKYLVFILKKYNINLKTIKNTKSQKKKIKKIDLTKNKININTDGLEKLCLLPGIGKVKAQRIIDYRIKNDKFTNIKELLKVKGIGQKTLDKIKTYIIIK